MPVLAGLAIAKDAPDPQGAAALIDYLTQPATQLTTARAVGFFPVVKAKLPADLDPGVKLAVGGDRAALRTPRTPCRRCCRSASARMAGSSTRSCSTPSSSSCCAA